MKTCNEIHPKSKVNTGFTCCYKKWSDYRKAHFSLAVLLRCIEQDTIFPSAVFDKFDLFGIKRVNQFEGYGRATESNEIPWHAYITKEYTGDQDYRSGDCRTFYEAAEWLAFHLEQLKSKLRGFETPKRRLKNEGI